MLSDYQSMYLGESQPIDSGLLDLARTYYCQTEAFDRTVCTGPITRDGIMPRTSRELALVNLNAANVFREIKRKAMARGFSPDDLRDAMRVAQRD